MTSTSSTYCLGAVASLKLLAIENISRIMVKLRTDNAWRAAFLAILLDNFALIS